MVADALAAIREELRNLAEPERVPELQRFFKTGPGDYAEGDVMIGVRVGPCRRVAKAHRDLPLAEAIELLGSEIHEERLVALLIMVDAYERRPGSRTAVYEAYLANTASVDNWDLVDVSCRDIVGLHLLERPRAPLYELAASTLIWDRRIAIVSTFAFIREDDLDDTFAIAELLLGDRHDLIHKATGWMLREAGKRDEGRLLAFIEASAPRMPRTMLRYAIEKFSPDERRRLMAL